jgi:TRAP-type C4-dicarboxylate transport system substrate-binding protein
MAIPDPDQANELFAEAVKRAKQKQAKYVQEDEQELIAQMKKVVTSP